MSPGDLLLHERGRAVAVVGADGLIYTHNLVLTPEQASRYRVVTPTEIPVRLRGYLDAARRAAGQR